MAPAAALLAFTLLLLAWCADLALACAAGDCDSGEGTLLNDDGSNYTGSFRGGAPHGVGTLTMAGGGSYTGTWAEGKRHGRGVEKYSFGELYDGEWREGRQHGTGRVVYRDGRTYEGTWENGQQHGRGELRFMDKSVYTGAFIRGVEHGAGVFVDAKGARYEGDWAAGLPAGRGKLTYPNGDTYAGEWHGGKEAGRGVQRFTNGTEPVVWCAYGELSLARLCARIAAGVTAHAADAARARKVATANAARVEQCVRGLPRSAQRVALKQCVAAARAVSDPAGPAAAAFHAAMAQLRAVVDASEKGRRGEQQSKRQPPAKGAANPK